MTKKIDTTVVFSLYESLAILDKYKENLTTTQYNNIKSNISNHAIENMFANEEDILNCIKIEKGDLTADYIVSKYKEAWGVL